MSDAHSAPPSGYEGDWITPSNSSYTKAISRWAANAIRKAAVVAFVKSTSDVILALSYAKANSLPIAVRGGGHSPAGASSVEGGLVVDLSRYFASVRVDEKAKVAYVGGGAVWETVDKEAIKLGLATVGGTVNHTGVGGLILGGGYGYLTGQHGLSLDNLVQATVVTSSGDVLTASSSSNPDLFWAIRGGGSNFGIVTEFVLKLHPQRKTVYAGIVAYESSKAEVVTQAVKEWWEAGPNGKDTIFQGFTTGPDGNPCVLLLLFWNGPEEEGRAHFKKFFDIGPVVDGTGEIPFEKINTLQNNNCPPGSSYYMKSTFLSTPQPSLSAPLLSAVHSANKSRNLRITYFYEFFPIGKILSVPSGETAYWRGERVSTMVFIAWDTPKDPSEEEKAQKLKEVREVATSLTDIVLSGEKKVLPEENTGYGNYESEELVPASRTGLSSAEALFGGNYAKLREVKQKYDPEMIFSRWFAIPPATK